MAKSAETWEGRRALTDNPNTGQETALGAARTLMSLDSLSEAAIFFALAGAQDGLREVMNRAVEEGNFFVFQQAATRLGEKGERAQLRSLIDAAERNGRGLYAAKAAEYLENL
ncbi:MAG: hypothetical protein LBV79_11390 [Candidatus Adiutrix sp.]|jgi:hypothetical protein|nr:hypothetical protein [Candidatus Adiutrix sp.]